MEIQQLLESANPYARVMDTANTLVSKWTKSGLLVSILISSMVLIRKHLVDLYMVLLLT